MQAILDYVLSQILNHSIGLDTLETTWTHMIVKTRFSVTTHKRIIYSY